MGLIGIPHEASRERTLIMTFESNASLGEFGRRNVSDVPETSSNCLPQFHDICRYVVSWNAFLMEYLTRCLCSLSHAFRCLSRPAASLAFTSEARREPHIIYDISAFVKLSKTGEAMAELLQLRTSWNLTQTRHNSDLCEDFTSVLPEPYIRLRP